VAGRLDLASSNPARISVTLFRADARHRGRSHPFAKLGVPTRTSSIWDYGYGNVFHHTKQDTLDQLSPKVCKITGDVILQTVWMLDVR